MTVRCEGDCRVMEQLGEKQDFESELSRLGFAHEAFTLYVRRARAPKSAMTWLANYTVCVTNVVTKRSNIYAGGAGERWVAQFAMDLAGGFYGSPDWRSAAHPKWMASRLRLVSGGSAET